MRLRKTEQTELKNKAVKMHQQGKFNKEIAKELNITEKTAGKWIKDFKQQTKRLETIKTNLINRLEQTLKDKTSTPKDIYCLIQSLNMWQNTSIC